MVTTATLTACSVASLGVGGGFAWVARFRPSYAARLELYGGALLATGLALLGAALRSSASVG
jgi:hypothetical protein